jgi:hypothetical protein
MDSVELQLAPEWCGCRKLVLPSSFDLDRIACGGHMRLDGANLTESYWRKLLLIKLLDGPDVPLCLPC